MLIFKSRKPLLLAVLLLQIGLLAVWFFGNGKNYLKDFRKLFWSVTDDESLPPVECFTFADVPALLQQHENVSNIVCIVSKQRKLAYMKLNQKRLNALTNNLNALRAILLHSPLNVIGGWTHGVKPLCNVTRHKESDTLVLSEGYSNFAEPMSANIQFQNGKPTNYWIVTFREKSNIFSFVADTLWQIVHVFQSYAVFLPDFLSERNDWWRVRKLWEALGNSFG